MNLIELFKKIKPYVYPYRWLVIITLILTLIGSLMAQVNAVVLDRTVDAINALINPEGFAWSKAAHILTVITIVLLGKEVLSAGMRQNTALPCERLFAAFALASILEYTSPIKRESRKHGCSIRTVLQESLFKSLPR